MNEKSMKSYINFPFLSQKIIQQEKRRESIKLIIKCKFHHNNKKKLILNHNNKNVQCPKPLKRIITKFNNKKNTLKCIAVSCH